GDRVVERHPALVHQQHQGSRDDRLRDRGDPADRARLDLAEARNLDLAVTRDESRRAGQPGALEDCPEIRHRAKRRRLWPKLIGTALTLPAGCGRAAATASRPAPWGLPPSRRTAGGGDCRSSRTV